MADELQKILDSKKIIEAELTKHNVAPCATSVQPITDELKKIETSAKILGDVSIQARYQNCSAWAIHYSTVRMTVATFTATTCLTIMGLKWDGAKVPLVIATMILATLGCLVFLVFTYNTLKMLDEQLAKGGSAKKTRYLKDIPTYVIVALTSGQLYLGLHDWLPQARERDAVSKDEKKDAAPTDNQPDTNRPPRSAISNAIPLVK